MSESQTDSDGIERKPDQDPDQASEVQCQITGEWYPEDEVVVFQGYTVGARGKAILMERLQAGQKLDHELERSSALQRFAALFIDGILFTIVSVVAMMIVGGATIFTPTATPQGSGIAIAVMTIVLGLLGLAYMAVLHAKYGQTLGKMAIKIKVVMPDGNGISSQTAWLRALYYQGPGLLGNIIAAIGLIAVTDALLLVSTAISGIATLYIIVSIIMALVDRDQQRTIHDRLANTRVIKL